MFIAHFGVGLAARAAAPRMSLGAAFLAAQWLDLLWPTLLLAGVERVAIVPGATAVTPLDFQHYPWSHSLLAVLAWSALFGAASLALRREKHEALLLGLLVASHWLLDAVAHRPDLPLAPFGEARVGLGLWQSLPATAAAELAVLGAGCWLYARATRPRDGAGRWGLVGLVAFLLLVEAGNLFGAPPPNATAIAWVGQAQWLLVLWGWWLDRHRDSVAAS